MLVKPVTYTDPFTNEKVTDTLLFNLTEAEVIDLEAHFNGNIVKEIQKILDSKDPEAIINMFKYILGKAYGERTPGTKKFIKSKEINDAFFASQAYSELLYDLLNDPNASQEFFNKVFPDMQNLKNRWGKIGSSGSKDVDPDVVIE